MKILKAKTKQLKTQILKISDLHYVKHGLILDDLLESKELINPIEVNIDHHTGTMGAAGMPYEKKKYVVYKGSRRVTTALKLGYTHIEAIVNDWCILRKSQS